MIKLIKKLGYRVDDCQWTTYNIDPTFLTQAEDKHIKNEDRIKLTS